MIVLERGGHQVKTTNFVQLLVTDFNKAVRFPDARFGLFKVYLRWPCLDPRFFCPWKNTQIDTLDWICRFRRVRSVG